VLNECEGVAGAGESPRMHEMVKYMVGRCRGTLTSLLQVVGVLSAA
jgi:hypothetical protein